MNIDPHEQLQVDLRNLRRDIAPPVDLWPGVAAAIAGAPANNVVALQKRPPAARRLLPPLALAASLVLALGLGVRMHSAAPPVTPQLHEEALAMAGEYQLALAALEQSPLQPELRPALDELDRSADQILGALQEYPGQRFLFDQLHRTYARRLELTQRAITF